MPTIDPFSNRISHGGGCAGFTLVELITTILIVAFIAGIGSSLFFNVNLFRQSGFYDETIAAVRYAQKYAVASGCAVQVQVSGNSFTLSQVPPAAYDPANSDSCNTPPYSGVMSDPSQGGGFTRAAPSGVTLTAAPATFVFCPWGDTSSTNTCTSSSGYNNVNVSLTVGTRTMTVYGPTGFVQAQ